MISKSFHLMVNLFQSLERKVKNWDNIKSPYSMAIDSNDNIYVLDRGNDRVVKSSYRRKLHWSIIFL